MATPTANKDRSSPRPRSLDSDADVVTAAVDVVRDRLPPAWSLREVRQPKRGAGARADAQLLMSAPDGSELRVLVEAKRLLTTREAPVLLAELRDAAAQAGLEDAVCMLAARYLAPPTRERIAELGGAYADATGNLLLTADRPGLALRDRGADRDPWRGPGRPRSSLQGPPAARVVRALVDFAPPFTVPEIVERAGASNGATYRVIEVLEQEDLLDRQRYGPVTDVKWRRVLERWSEDYGFAASNTVVSFLEPRGLAALTGRLKNSSDLDYVVTGSLAAARATAYAPARLAAVYVRDIDTAAERLGLRTVETGGNVALATGRYDVAFERADAVDGLRVAALSQTAVDLLTGPGRNPSEGAALLDWMEANERVWRR